MSQKSTAIMIYKLTMKRSKKMIIKTYGSTFYQRFKELSNYKFNELIKEYPDIGKSMFAFNYAYAPGYVAWWTSMEKLGLSQDDCEVLMLKMNEKMLLTVPKCLLHAVGKLYLRNMQKGAILRNKENPIDIHPFDWKIKYIGTDKGDFNINIYTCGFIAYARKYGGIKMLPSICQVDYMVSHYMNVGFDRTQTLGSGGNLCDCKYSYNGKCSWDIEKRLKERK